MSVAPSRTTRKITARGVVQCQVVPPVAPSPGPPRPAPAGPRGGAALPRRRARRAATAEATAPSGVGPDRQPPPLLVEADGGELRRSDGEQRGCGVEHGIPLHGAPRRHRPGTPPEEAGGHDPMVGRCTPERQWPDASQADSAMPGAIPAVGCGHARSTASRPLSCGARTTTSRARSRSSASTTCPRARCWSRCRGRRSITKTAWSRSRATGWPGSRRSCPAWTWPAWWWRATTPHCAVGTEVLAHGGDLGVARHGGYARYARVAAGLALALPDGLSARQAMAIGTAGFTAALSLDQLEQRGLRPRRRARARDRRLGRRGIVRRRPAGGARATRWWRAPARPTSTPGSSAWARPTVIGRDDLDEAGGPGARPRALGRRRGLRRGRDPGADPADAALRRGGGRQRAHRRHRPADHGVLLHHPRRGAARGGLGADAHRTATRRVGPPGHATSVPPTSSDLVAGEVTLDGVAGALADILASRVRGRVLVRVDGPSRRDAAAPARRRRTVRAGAVRWSGTRASPGAEHRRDGERPRRRTPCIAPPPRRGRTACGGVTSICVAVGHDVSVPRGHVGVARG